MSQRDFEGIALVAPVSLARERYSARGAHWFIGRTLAAMLEASGLKKDAVDGLAAGSFTLAPDGVPGIAEYFDLAPRWMEHLCMGGASGVVAARRAARAVQCGDAGIVACIGADTNRPGGFRDLVSGFSRFAVDGTYPYGGAGPNLAYAMITRHYMDRFGATREDFGRICIAQRHNALACGPGLFADPLSMASYLAARPVAEPLHLFDCVMPCAGAEGFLVMATERARALGAPYVEMASSAERYNAFAGDPVHFRGGWRLFRDALYDAAGLGPADMDMLQTYDDYPVVVMMQLEDLGFCGAGEAPEFVRRTPLTFDGGALPHNTSGGQLSGGQAGFAGGFLGIVEAVRQLSAPALPNAVPGARTALVSGYGMVNYDHCLCTSAAILQRGGI